MGDINNITSAFKVYLYCDMLEKPQEEITIRPTEAGGLGLYNVEMRSLSFLINNFLQTSANPKFKRNNYHETLLRCYVFDEDLIKKPNIPTYYSGNFFHVIKNLKRIYNLEKVTLKEIYSFLIDTKIKDDPYELLVPPKYRLLKCEERHPDLDWDKTWINVRKKA